jgi:serine/threonine protein kinase
MTEGKLTLLNNFFPGNQFRQYKLLEQIGVGGIGLVWSALDQIQNCIVAIKLNEIDEDNQTVNFIMLDRHITGLHHPFVLPTYDFGIWQNIQYIVTPYIPGGSLEDRLNDTEPFQIQEALQYAAEIASALDFLHGENVIHRDLKPANILINFDHHLYVADFDLARVLSETTQSMHTGRGTPAYAPPEQHRMAVITPQSDLYSLGIVLFEMFTRKLPWNGEVSLGIQQLSSNAEMPDPREINPDLPAGLVEVLRKMTDVNPNNRPKTAGEAMQMVYSCFEMEPIIVSTNIQKDEIALRDFESAELLRISQARWEQSGETSVLNLTKFAFIDLKYSGVNETLAPNTLRFMLTNALFFGYQDNYWWKKITGPNERLSIASQILSKKNEAIKDRIVNHLIEDHEIHSLTGKLPKDLINSLIEITYKTQNDSLREKTLSLIRNLTRAPLKWRETAFGVEADKNLGLLATQETATGAEAAKLIGHLHSESAALAVLRTANINQLSTIFQNIQLAAGSLPASIPFNLRLIVTGKRLQQLLTARPTSLLLVFAMAFLGTAIGTSLQIFFTYRLPSFLDLERITVSIERGGFLGVVFGLGILVTRLIAERISMLNTFPRIMLATIIGGLGLNIGLFTYDVLILQNAPHGLLVTTGCLLIAFGYAIGTLLRGMLAKTLVSALAIFTALAGSWWVHVNLATASTDISPVFFYEYTWAFAQVLGIVLLATLPMAILGNLFDLSVQEM